MDFIKEIEQMGLTVEQYENCIKDIQDKAEGNIDIEWDEIREKYNLPISCVTLRKANSKPFGGAFIKSYIENKQDPSSTSYEAQRDALRREKVKLSDERAALRKISREAARNEETLEYLKHLIQTKDFPDIQQVYSPVYDSDNDLLIAVSDVHYGLDVSNAFGSYNAQIAKERMDKYLNRILEIQRTHHSQNAWVMLGGDLINGALRKTIQLQNRENIVEQIQGVSELLSLFIYKLSKAFDTVYVNGTCGGNHSRCGEKDDVLRGERMDLLVPWYINARLSGVSNVEIINDSIDPSIAFMTIRGKNYSAVHGDFDNLNENGINRLMNMINRPCEAILFGHLHHCTYDEIANIKVVRSGSFCDPVDDYSISKRIVGHASQMVMVVDSSGIQSFYPVDLR